MSRAEPEAQGNRVEYRREGLTEWYINGPLGLEQGFTLPAPPGCQRDGSRGVVIRLGGGGALRSEVSAQGDAAVLRGASGKAVLRSTDLYVSDATGRQLPGTLRAGVDGLSIRVDDRGATYPIQVDPLWTLQQELTASDGAADNFFGRSVAVSGDTAVVGAHAKASFQGAAYVFVRSGNTWTQQQKLTASDGAEGDQFGISVAVSGDTAVVGASDNALDQGAAYVFAPVSIGHACSTAGECVTGFCVDGVCCDTACADGLPNDCQGCSKAQGAIADGTCTLLTDTKCDDDDACTPTDVCQEGACIGLNRNPCVAQNSCQGDGVCDPKDGNCKDFPYLCSGGNTGAPSTMADHLGAFCDSQQDCANIGGFCVAEGEVKVCCDAPCLDLCSSCLLPGHVGTCQVEPQGVDLRGVCSQGESCSRTCSGPVKGGEPHCIDADETTQCSVQQCKDKTHAVTSARCEAKGSACPEGVPIDCSPYACDPVQGRCGSRCKATSDCVGGFVCDPSNRCVPPPPRTSMVNDALCSLQQGTAAGEAPPRSTVLGWLLFAAIAPLRRSRRLREGRR